MSEFTQVTTLVEDSEYLAAVAYQVVGALAYKAGVLDHPKVIEALDYFNASPEERRRKELLPWAIPE